MSISGHRCKHGSKRELTITKFSNFLQMPNSFFFVTVQTGPNFRGISPSVVIACEQALCLGSKLQGKGREKGGERM